MALRLERIATQIKLEEPPIETYRRQSKIDKQALKLVFYGEESALRDQIFDLIMKNRDLFEHGFLLQHDRAAQRKRSAEQLLFFAKNNPVSFEQYLKNPHTYALMINALHTFDNSLCVKLIAHFALYFKTIMSLGTKKHQRHLMRAYHLKDVGCFGMTQFNHGSNVRGVKTQAHYCHKTKTFTIHTPTTEDMKFWIGAAANMANMSVVFAQLYIDGKCYGVHSYIVPIRDPDTHDLYPGVLIGDCGPKMGLNGIDNGFMIFDQYRIPKDNQLDRLSGVDENGKFFSTIPNEDKRFATQLGALSGGRVHLAYTLSTTMVNSITIALRYVLNRKQFAPPKSFDEVLLFDYPLTRYRLMPLIATTVVYIIGGKSLSLEWDRNQSNLLDPNNKILPELHAISSALKPICSWFIMETIEVGRQLLGGHGYSTYSRYANLFNDAEVNSTWEGDNYVLFQQTSKYLLDGFRKASSGKLPEGKSLKFLQNLDVKVESLSEKNIGDFKYLEVLFQKRVIDRLNRTVARLTALASSGKNNIESWQAIQANYAVPLALAYGDLYYIQSFIKVLATIQQPALKAVLESCGRLWAYRCLHKESYGDDEQKKLIQERMREECEQVAKEAVAITDAMAAPAYIIGSPFADEHGEGMKSYYNILFSGEDTFRKVDWYQDIVHRDRRS